MTQCRPGRLRTIYPDFKNVLATIALILVPICLMVVSPGHAMADATPLQVVLEYLNGVSNWGPKTASGVAEIVRAEGEVRLSARGLPEASNAHYVLWLVREGSDAVFRVGEVSRQPDGTATVDLLLLDAIPNSGWNMALVTVEDNVNADRPGTRHALAGRYPRPLPQGTLPIGLPNTG